MGLDLPRIIKAYVAKQGWKVSGQQDDNIIMLFGSKEEHHLLVLKGVSAKEYIVIRCLLPQNVPEKSRKRMIEYITRANYGLGHGCFKMDERDGEIEFQSSMDVEGCNEADIMLLLEFYVGVSSGTWDKYEKGVRGLMVDDKTDPAILIQMIEGS
eukprot:TRINITY_DN516_c0_g2_i1.p1 TRINITY_DN516_c0_g2~~TRINITY_DN516_c0_g2_i1.p1  ORF type:complete len:155 (-),score=27.95 TRINITY_DN516_c0_g2_i1:145-609(-)